MYKERILRRETDLSYAKGSFQVNLYKMIWVVFHELFMFNIKCLC